ncbi:MAG: polysaccharide deacetylase family protein [Thermodesulfovibrionales bacterium]|nr:polysaccharide deacetylase family protein [Thermodesulfovibrionales bacterium]
MDRHILITIDIEEFDIPREFGIEISDDDTIQISSQGTERFFNVINSLNIPCTAFITTHFAQKKTELIRSIAERHEIASHGYYHTNHVNDNLASSKIDIEKIIGQEVLGFRQPRLMNVDTKLLCESGYLYNSSLNPTWIPGRYMNLNKPRLPFSENKIINLPISVTPLLRFPLFWITFKNIPIDIYKKLCCWTLKNDKYLHLLFHPWEFADIKDFNLPNYIKRPCGNDLCDRLSDFLSWISQYGRFLTCRQYIEYTNHPLF